MKPISWVEFISNISDDEMHEIIRDYKQLQADGFIGECLLRTYAQKWVENLNNAVLLSMRDIVFEAYKRFYTPPK